MFGQLTFLLDSVSRAACLPARAAAGAYLRSAYRGMACSLAGDQQMPRIMCVGLLLPESGEVMWTWNCRRRGRAYPCGQPRSRGLPPHGRCWPRPLGPPPAVVAPPPAALSLQLPSGTPGARGSRPSQCTACPPTGPARLPKGSPAGTQCSAQSPASDAGPRTSSPSLPTADTLALPASPGIETALAPSPAPAAAPSPTQSPESAPTAPAARDETPPPCPAGS